MEVGNEDFVLPQAQEVSLAVLKASILLSKQDTRRNHFPGQQRSCRKPPALLLTHFYLQKPLFIGPYLTWPLTPKEDFRSQGTGVRAAWEPPDICSGN